MVKTFIEKISKIIAVVTAFINSIVEIAAGNIGAAAAKVESILGGLLSLAISFLAGFVGLGKVASKVRDVITKVRAVVDKALDTAINFIIGKAKALFKSLFSGKPDKRTDAQKQADLDKAIAEAKALQSKPDITDPDVRKGLISIKSKYKMGSLELVVDNTDDVASTETVHVEGEINPRKKSDKGKIASKNQVITEISIPRPSSFKASTKRTVNPDNLDLIGKGLDRCHVVSSSDMAKHYEDTLKGKKWTEAKKLLETKQPVAALTDKAILAAAKALHKKFFNDVDNLFLGESGVNRALGEKLDPRHPDMKKLKDLEAHIARMVTTYGLGPVKISR